MDWSDTGEIPQSEPRRRTGYNIYLRRDGSICRKNYEQLKKVNAHYEENMAKPLEDTKKLKPKMMQAILLAAAGGKPANQPPGEEEDPGRNDGPLCQPDIANGGDQSNAETASADENPENDAEVNATNANTSNNPDNAVTETANADANDVEEVGINTTSETDATARVDKGEKPT